MYNINQFIEHTLLKPDISEKDISRLIDEAFEHNFLGVCVPPFWVKKAAAEISKSPLQLVTVIGFPFGYNLTETKLDEIKRCIDFGANELDIVMNVSSFKSNLPWTKIELAKCANLVHQNGCLMKVIIETAFLTENEIVEACKICVDAGTDFVKTSTGYAPYGATVKDVKLIRKCLPNNVGVKASGGIRDVDTVLKMIESGADRIGMSSSVEIMKRIQEINLGYEG